MQFSVIVPTFNRAQLVRRALDSVLQQRGVDFELIVVDDGSTDGTAEQLSTVSDGHLVKIAGENRGACAARNTGIAQASGDWITFLDDDDEVLPDWLNTLAGLITNNTGLVCCGATVCTPGGEVIDTLRPGPMGRLFADQSGLVLAGTFAIRADVLRSIGGYDERLRSRQQTDLAIRLVPALLERGLQIQSVSRPLVRIEERQAQNRTMTEPAALYEATTALLQKHAAEFARSPVDRANYHAVRGVNAARLGEWRVARAALRASVRAQPMRARHWLRLAAVCYRPLGRRLWRTALFDKSGL